MIQISTTHSPATDLGFLLHKNPNRVHELELSFGKATILYPVADEAKCSIALLLDLDTIALVRGKEGSGGSLKQYVNDRPYVASSFLASALVRCFGTTISGRCKDKPELVNQILPFEVEIPVIACRAGEQAFKRLFEPLGYEVAVERIALDEKFPEWGESEYYSLRLSGTKTTQDLLRHLYVLLPVLDARKHYAMEESEVNKLLTKGADWLAAHPEKNWIIRAYFGRKTSFIRSALEQLANVEPALDEEEAGL